MRVEFLLKRCLRLAALLALVLPFTVGCVSYAQYRKVQEELSRTQDSHRDLVARYNRDIQKRGPITTTIEGVSEVEYAKVIAENADLRAQLRDRPLAPEFSADDALKVGAQIEDGGLALSSGLLFNPGEAELKSSHLPSLDALAQVLQAPDYAGQRFVIEGHTDNEPLRSVKNLYWYNINLGYERAYSVFKYLEKKHGIPEDRFRIVTFGMTKPKDPATASTEAGRSENRRVVVRLTGERF